MAIGERMEREMKKITLTLGAALVALTAISATGAEAGGKKHFGWHKPHWKTFYLGEPHYCFWKKKKIFTHKGWFWKKVKVCKPVWYF